jgi:hypothetical protein
VSGPGKTLTDDEVNLGTKVKLEERVTHEVNHFDSFDDPHKRNTLAYTSIATHMMETGTKRTPITLFFLAPSTLS